MAHEITERDGLFTVRRPAWHGLGVVMENYPTRAEAQAAGHPWEPIPEPIYRRVPVIKAHEHTWECEHSIEECDLHDDLSEEYVEVEGWVGAARSDDGFLLGVNTDTFGLVTNSELYDIAEAIEGEAKGSVMYETGGSLKGGAKVWLLIRLREPLVIGGDDRTATIPYYALQNAHDGSGSFRGQSTYTRIVCDNTARAADLDAQQRGTEFVFRHSKNVKDRVNEAREALAGWRESIQGYRLMSEHLLSMDVSPSQQWDFVEQFIPMPKIHTASERVQANVREARGELWDILGSATCESIRGTSYGLVEASIEYMNHARRARSNETRFKRAYLDANTIVSDAVELAQAASLA